jgi:putative ABC transport system substrate-binding protein
MNLLIALVSTLLILGVYRPASGQTSPARIAVLGAPEEPRFTEVVGGLKQGLRDLNYLEKDVEFIEGRVGRDDQVSARAFVERMVRQRVQVLFAIGSRLVTLTRQVSSDLPIVFLTPGDPMASGVVNSLARPGGNTTGMTFEYPELSGKRLELLKEVAPKIRRVLIMYDPRDKSPKQGVAIAKEAAPKLGVTLVERMIRNKEDMARELRALGGADALLAVPGGEPTAHYKDMILAANSRRLPTIFHARSRDTELALATYGANDAEIARHAARLVDKILKGANAGELPVERPARFEFVINLKTAKEIGLTVPPNVLVRADRVIR